MNSSRDEEWNTKPYECSEFQQSNTWRGANKRSGQDEGMKYFNSEQKGVAGGARLLFKGLAEGDVNEGASHATHIIFATLPFHTLSHPHFHPLDSITCEQILLNWSGG